MLAIGFPLTNGYGQSPNGAPANAPANNPVPAPPSALAVKPEPPVYKYSCQQPQNAEQENLCIERRAALASEEQALWAKRTFWIGLGGTIAVILTFGINTVATSVASRGAKAAERSAKAAEDALLKLERPFVFAEGFPWLWHADLGQNRVGRYWYSIRPLIANSGNTPTQNMTINVEFDLRDTPLPDNFDFPYKAGASETRIAPKGNITAQIVRLSDDDLLAIQDSKKFFYIWGIAKYRDFFEGTPLHVTIFCAQIGNVLGNPLDPRPRADNTPGVSFDFRIHPRYNQNT